MHVDMNCWIGRWPFQQHGDWSLNAMASRLSSAGISVACVASLEAVLLPDVATAELKLADDLANWEAREHFQFLHTPLICDASPRWKLDLATARDGFGSRMIRLAPTYRPRGFDADHLAEIISHAYEMGMHTALAMRLEDERSQSPIVNISSPPINDVIRLSKTLRSVPFVLLNAYLSELRLLASHRDADGISFDTAMLDGASPLDSASALVGPSRLVFGSAAPLLHAPAASRKLVHSELAEAVLRKIKNASSIFCVNG